MSSRTILNAEPLPEVYTDCDCYINLPSCLFERDNGVVGLNSATLSEKKAIPAVYLGPSHGPTFTRRMPGFSKSYLISISLYVNYPMGQSLPILADFACPGFQRRP